MSVQNTEIATDLKTCPRCAASLADAAMQMPPDLNLKKCAVILRDGLAPGLAVNAAAVVSVTLGKLRPEIVGRDLLDATTNIHPGITTMAIPILKADGAELTAMRARMKDFEPELLVVDVISATRTTKSYDEYAAVLEATLQDDVEYFGLALFGDKKTVTRFTGGLALLR